MIPLAPKAIAFDAYGTLVAIGDKRRPYAALAALTHQSLDPSPLVQPLDLEAAYRGTGVILDSDVLASLKHALDDELASITSYPETSSVLKAVKAAGIRTAVASNLALPYAQPIHRLFGALIDVHCFSFEVGAVKPDGAFYEALCQQLGLPATEVLMVGDTWRCDYAGAQAAGLKALHLDRRGNATEEQRAASLRTLGDLLPLLLRIPVRLNTGSGEG